MKHFHCTRCGYSFINYQALEPHHDKHLQDDQDSVRSTSIDPTFVPKTRPDSPMDGPITTSLSSNDSPMKSQGNYIKFDVNNLCIYHP